MRRIVVHNHGGPEVMSLEQVDRPRPGSGQVLVRNQAIGVNFIDIYFRNGIYKPEELPFVPGNEGAGEVIDVGPDVSDIHVGMRVAYVGPIGAYAEERLIPAERLIPLPDFVSYEQSAAMMLKGLTAQYLLRQTYPVGANTTLLFHAAAGGVGSIACAWAKKLGATVIGTAGNPEKAERAKAMGCDHVILYNDESFAERVRDITNGKGCDVVYDSVGEATFLDSLDCLKPRGLMVSFGNASGSVKSFDLGLLAQKGSLFVTRPTLFGYASERKALLAMAKDLFDALDKQWITIDICHEFTLSEAPEAHRMMEERKTQGSLILKP